MSTSQKRIAYIKSNYSLTLVDGIWVAKSPYSEIKGADHVRVRFEARCRWGHFNFEDEARAFAEIFPSTVGQHFVV